MASFHRSFSDWLRQESHDQRPDYSLDRWIQMATDLGGNVQDMVKKAKDDEVKLDKQKKSQDSKSKAKHSSAIEDPKSDDGDDDKEKKTWDELRKIHQDRAKEFGKDLDKKIPGNKAS